MWIYVRAGCLPLSSFLPLFSFNTETLFFFLLFYLRMFFKFCIYPFKTDASWLITFYLYKCHPFTSAIPVYWYYLPWRWTLRQKNVVEPFLRHCSVWINQCETLSKPLLTHNTFMFCRFGNAMFPNLEYCQVIRICKMWLQCLTNNLFICLVVLYRH